MRGEKRWGEDLWGIGEGIGVRRGGYGDMEVDGIEGMGGWRDKEVGYENGGEWLGGR